MPTPDNRLPDPRANAAQSMLYPALSAGQSPLVIEQHEYTHRHTNRALLISAEWALLHSPIPYYPTDPDDPPDNAKSTTVDFLDMTGETPQVILNIMNDGGCIHFTLNAPFLLDGYGHEDITANFNPEMLATIDRDIVIELTYLAIVEQIEEDKYDEVDEIRSLQYLASMAASNAVHEAIEAASLKKLG